MQKKFIFFKKILNWYHFHGRKNLPWQKNNNLYTRWISEIMLQQTKVKTVIPYYKKFIKEFPTILKLCQKNNLNKILYIWSGLGYYKRAMYIYKTTKIIKKNFNNKFPDVFNIIIKFPGIGKTTAGAILSLSKNYFFSILDGNVKRIIKRFFFLKNNIKEKKLWKKIELLTPLHNAGKFNQAMMDFGYKICTFHNPKCLQCPIKKNCKNKHKIINKNFKKNSIKKFFYIWLIFFNYKNLILLKKNKNQIWKNLFCPLMFNKKKTFFLFLNKNKIIINKKKKMIKKISNKKICIIYYILKINKTIKKNFHKKKYLWFNMKKPQIIGIPQPIKKIIFEKIIKN